MERPFEVVVIRITAVMGWDDGRQLPSLRPELIEEGWGNSPLNHLHVILPTLLHTAPPSADLHGLQVHYQASI